MGTLHCTLENGAYLYVIEHQKMRHYRARSAEERRKKNAKLQFFISRGAYVNLRYIAMLYIHSIANQPTRWWCLKCTIVYLARNIPTFVMYCIYGTSRSSLLIESTDSMIIIGRHVVWCIIKK